MDAAAQRADGKSVWDALLGLQLGVIGGILMLVWFALISPVLGHPWWLIPNLFASHFYNSREVYLGPGIVTIVGMAVQIVTSGIIGCLTGVITPGGRLSGIGAAIAWYAVCLLFLWKRMAPLMLVQPIQPILWAGYFLFGSALGWHRHLVRARRATLAG
jgi:hypothetical protein